MATTTHGAFSWTELTTSDRKAALLADVVFAKGALADWCDWYDVPHYRFAALADVHAALVP